MATEAELGWLAGIIDGEGCIYAHWQNKRKYSTGGNVSVEIRVEAVSFVMISKCASICDGIGVGYTIESGRMARWQLVQPIDLIFVEEIRFLNS